ncbi:hypothetical protein [Bradyrhizobium sp. USDA 4454]
MDLFADCPAKAAAAQRRSRQFYGEWSSRLASPRMPAEKFVAPENAVVTSTNATRTHACAGHASDPSPLVAILHWTIATRQFFPNHRFDVIGFFESVSREARVFESRINFFEATRLICLMHAFNA